MNVIEKITESNRIEGILRPPTTEEVNEFDRFLLLRSVTIEELDTFVRVYQPNAVLRSTVGLNVRVGRHLPQPGGPKIVESLNALLDIANDPRACPWLVHLQYEDLHPFTDGNGRSGRMLWYWMMQWHAEADLGFLHTFYYQTLRNAARS